MDYTDNELVQQIKGGDVRTFERVFHQYGESLVRYSGTIVKDPDEAEDIVQQLFVNLWTKRESLDVNTSLKSYLYKAVYNSSLNRIKQQTVKESYVEYISYVGHGMSAAASFAIEQKEASSVIEKAIEDLPEQCRVVFRMSRFDQLKYQQIADQLGISVKTVENHMGKALKHMRERLKDYMVILFYLLLSQ